MPPETETKILKSINVDRIFRILTIISLCYGGYKWGNSEIHQAVNDIKVALKDTSTAKDFYVFKEETVKRLNRNDSMQNEILNILNKNKK